MPRAAENKNNNKKKERKVRYLVKEGFLLLLSG